MPPRIGRLWTGAVADAKVYSSVPTCTFYSHLCHLRQLRLEPSSTIAPAQVEEQLAILIALYETLEYVREIVNNLAGYFGHEVVFTHEQRLPFLTGRWHKWEQNVKLTRCMGLHTTEQAARCAVLYCFTVQAHCNTNRPKCQIAQNHNILWSSTQKIAQNAVSTQDVVVKNKKSDFRQKHAQKLYQIPLHVLCSMHKNLPEWPETACANQVSGWVKCARETAAIWLFLASLVCLPAVRKAGEISQISRFSRLFYI